MADDGLGRDGALYTQMAEMKTRMQPSKPRDGQTRNACFQVRIHENDMASPNRVLMYISGVELLSSLNYIL